MWFWLYHFSQIFVDNLRTTTDSQHHNLAPKIKMFQINITKLQNKTKNLPENKYTKLNLSAFSVNQTIQENRSVTLPSLGYLQLFSFKLIPFIQPTTELSAALLNYFIISMADDLACLVYSFQTFSRNKSLRLNSGFFRIFPPAILHGSLGEIIRFL